MDLTPLPSALLAHFSGHVTVTAAELCRLWPMDAKTLRRHIAAERLVGLQKGFGRKKPRREFTEAQIAAFIAALSGDAAGDLPCQSTSQKPARSGNSISRSNIIALPDRHAAGMNVTRRPSRPKNAKRQKPSSSD